MRLGFALCEVHNPDSIGEWYETKKLTEVDPASSVDDLKRELRSWGLAALKAAHIYRFAWYCAFLVELDEEDAFDTYLSLHDENIFWSGDGELVPVDD